MADSPAAKWLLYGSDTPIRDFFTNDRNLQVAQNVAVGVAGVATTVVTGGMLLEAAPGIFAGLGVGAAGSAGGVAPLAAGAAGIVAANPQLPEEIEEGIVSTAQSLGPELQTLGPELRNSLSNVELNERFASVVREQNQLLAAHLRTYSQLYLSPGEFDAAVGAPARAYGQILERMVADAVAADPDLALNFEYLSGPNAPDFTGHGPLEGLLFDVTTNLGEASHYLRFYGENLVVHTYTRPGSVGF
jgi:hypothetical protein